MKTKKNKGKLTISKITVARLDNHESASIKGGASNDTCDPCSRAFTNCANNSCNCGDGGSGTFLEWDVMQ